MKLLVVGATGQLGLHLVDAGLKAGHEVTALARSPGKLRTDSPRFHILGGNPLDTEQLVVAARGHDGVVTAMGAPTLRPTTIRADFARSLVPALTRAGTLRVVVTSVAFLFPDAGFFTFLLGGTLFRNVRADAARMEAAVIASRLDWTIVRPPRFVTGAFTGKYRTSASHLPRGAWSIRLGDLAHFMIGAAAERIFVRQIVGIGQ